MPLRTEFGCDLGLARLAQLRGKGRVFRQAADGLDQGRDVVGGNQEARDFIFEPLAHTAHVAGDHGTGMGHGFNSYDAKRFGP